MITWKDFVLDDVVGPVLSFLNETEEQELSCREMRFGSTSIRNDAKVAIQETGQEQRPARMVGQSSLISAQTDMEVGRCDRANSSSRRRGED